MIVLEEKQVSQEDEEIDQDCVKSHSRTHKQTFLKTLNDMFFSKPN